MEKDVNKVSEGRNIFMQLIQKTEAYQYLGFRHLEEIEGVVEEYADQQTAALRKEVEKWEHEAKEAWRKIEIYKDEASRYKKEGEYAWESYQQNNAEMVAQLSQLAETNKRLEGHMDSYILENAKLESELTTLRSEKGLANVLPTDEEIEKEANWRFTSGHGVTDVDRVCDFGDGAKWMRDRLQNQSPEKSPTDGGWISVEKEPPVDSGDVLITNENGFLATGWYDHDNKMWFALVGAGVTHWMPLPPPSRNTTITFN